MYFLRFVQVSQACASCTGLCRLRVRGGRLISGTEADLPSSFFALHESERAS